MRNLTILMDLSKYRGVQTVEMDRTDAFLPTLSMWDSTCQQCYSPYTKPQIQAGIRVLHATEIGISLRQTRAGKRSTFSIGVSPKNLAHLQSIRPPQSGSMGTSDQWDSGAAWCQADLPGFYNPTPLRLAGTWGPAAVWSFFFKSGSDWKRDTRSCTLW